MRPNSDSNRARVLHKEPSGEFAIKLRSAVADNFFVGHYTVHWREQYSRLGNNCVIRCHSASAEATMRFASTLSMGVSQR